MAHKTRLYIAGERIELYKTIANSYGFQTSQRRKADPECLYLSKSELQALIYGMLAVLEDEEY